MKHIIALLIAAASLTPSILPAQTQNGWELFDKVEFGKKFFEEYGMSLPWPKFDDHIRSWQGKEIMLTGYIIPTADASGYEGLILSKYTYSMCFFCGKAGMGTVAEVIPKKAMKDFRIDKPYIFKGRLKLNENDPDHLVFILTEAELMDL